MDLKTVEECLDSLQHIKWQTEGMFNDKWSPMDYDNFDKRLNTIEDALKKELEIQKVDYEVAQKVAEILDQPAKPNEELVKVFRGELDGDLPI